MMEPVHGADGERPHRPQVCLVAPVEAVVRLQPRAAGDPAARGGLALPVLELLCQLIQLLRGQRGEEGRVTGAWHGTTHGAAYGNGGTAGRVHSGRLVGPGARDSGRTGTGFGVRALMRHYALRASALTAPELPNSPNQDLGVRKHGGNGGKWRKVGGGGMGGNVGGLGGNGGKWRKMGGGMGDNGKKMEK